MQMVTDRLRANLGKSQFGAKNKNRKMPLFFCLKSHNILFHFLCQDKDQSLTIFGVVQYL
jgi:hypothetical protein